MNLRLMAKVMVESEQVEHDEMKSILQGLQILGFLVRTRNKAITKLLSPKTVEFFENLEAK